MYSGYLTIIIELIDSICRDSTDTQYMIIQNKLSKSKKTISLYYKTISSSVFIINNTPSGAKKASRKYQTRKSPESQNASLSSSYSDWLVQCCMHDHFVQTAAFYTEQCTSPLLFHLKSHKVVRTGH